jgi:6-phosphogluconolactonase
MMNETPSSTPAAGDRKHRRVEVLPTKESLIRVACELVTAAAMISIVRRGVFRIALAGGSTPRPLYERLAEDPDIDWRRWHVFWSDERCVPPEHPESNYRMAKEALLDRLTIKPGLVVRMPGELDPDVAAATYEQNVRELVPAKFEAGENLPPRFDLILLGMGNDGHTASLFPYTAALNESERLVVANHVPQLDTTRLTFTFPLINEARRAIFLVSGADKAETLREVLTGPYDPQKYPSQGVNLRDGQLTWLVDEAAFAAIESDMQEAQ